MVPIKKVIRTDPLDGGIDHCIELDMSWRGKLHQLIIVDTGGTGAGFTFAVYDKATACPATNSSSSSSAGSNPMSKEVHRILEDVTVSTDVGGFNLDGLEDGVCFENKDRNNRGDTQSRKLYLAIRPAAAGPAAFDIGYTFLSFQP